MSKRLPRLLASLIALLLLPAILRAQDSEEAKKVLAALRTRDAIVDNVRIHYDRSGEHLHKIPWDLNGQNGQPFLPPKLLKYCNIEDAVVRGDNISFTGNADPKRTEVDARYGVSTTFHRWSSRDGVYREWSRMPGENKATDIEFETSDARCSIIRELWMARQFGFGFGYGKRVEIQSIETTKTGWVIEGPFHVWTKDVSKCRLEIDRDYVVRKATIDADANGNLWRFEIETAGAVGEGHVVFAKSGHFKRSWQGVRKNGKIEGKPDVREEEHFTFRNAEFHLKDDVYESLTDFTPPVHSYVRDQDTGAQYEVDAKGKVRITTPPRPAK